MEVLWCALILIFSLFYFILKLASPQNKNPPPPPIPPALPIIGHLHLLKPPTHRTLKALSTRYGPVLRLRLGRRPAVLVSSPSAAEQCFTQNDVVFAHRPTYSLPGKHLSYNHTALGFAPYGGHWRNLRRVTAVHIFSSTSLHMSSAARNEEIRILARNLFRSFSDSDAEIRVNLKSVFSDFVFNSMMGMVAGKRWSDSNWGIFGPSILMSICDYIPMLRWVGFKGLEKKLVNLARKRDEFLQNLIDESRRSKINNCSAKKQRKTMIEALLSMQEEEPEFFTEDIIKGILLAMFTAGTHTSSITMEWAMALLLNHPEALQKARDEIDNNLEPNHLLEESDLPKLPYLHCIINETLRLFPAAPLLLPHFSSHDCVINGFNIPKGTTLLVNAWVIQRDPGLYEEPNKFKPERFEKGDYLRELGFKYLPFGMGRRACPGAGLAMRLVGLGLGLLIQCFEWERIGPELVDLGEGSGGLTLFKAKPLEAMCIPRPLMTSLLSQL